MRVSLGGHRDLLSGLFLALAVLVCSHEAAAQPASPLPPVLWTPVAPADPGGALAASSATGAFRDPSTCVGSEVNAFGETDTPSIYNFGPSDFVTGIPAPTLGATGFYESVGGVASGKEVCQVQAALGQCANASGTLQVRVVVYAPDASDETLPDLTAPLGGSAPFDPVAAGCPAGAVSFAFVEVPMTAPVDLEDRSTFVVGLEIVQAGPGDSVVLISSLNGEGGAAGRNSVDGTNFGLIDYLTFVGIDFTLGFRFNSQTARLTGADGWRMLAAPSTGATVGGGGDGTGTGFLDFLWTQGYPGADGGQASPEGASVFRYDETVVGDLGEGYVPPVSADEALVPGTGLFVYVYEDDDLRAPGIQGGFPKTLGVAGPEPTLPFSFAPSFTSSGTAVDDGWGLFGNPFRNGLDWDASGWTKTAMSNAIYVYDPLTDAYLTWNGAVGDLLSGVIGPYQGFWAQAMGAGPALVAPTGSVVSGGTFIGRPEAVPQITFEVETTGAGAVRSDRAFVTMQEGAVKGLDRYDAFELAGVGPAPIRVFAVVEDVDGPLALNIAALPEEGASELEIGVERAEAGGAVLRWPDVSLPDGWLATLMDTETGVEVDLLTETEYAFTVSASGRAHREGGGRPGTSLLRVSDEEGVGVTGGGRFVLRLDVSVVSTENAPGSISVVSPVFPNPTTGMASVRVSVTVPERVRVTVYDGLGRIVQMPFDATVTGREEIGLDSSGLAMGTYVVRVEGSSFVEMRRLVVAR